MNYKALSILLVTTTGMVNGRHVRFGRSDLPATQEKTLEGGSYGSGDSVIRYEPEDIDVVTRRASDTSITPVASPLPLLIPTLHPLESSNLPSAIPSDVPSALPTLGVVAPVSTSPATVSSPTPLVLLPTTAIPTIVSSLPQTTLPTTLSTITPTTLATTITSTSLPTSIPPTNLLTTIPTTMNPATIPSTILPTTIPPTILLTTIPPTTLLTTIPPTVLLTTIPPTVLLTTIPPTTLLTTIPTTILPTTIPPTIVPSTILPTLPHTTIPPTGIPTTLPTLHPTTLPSAVLSTTPSYDSSDKPSKTPSMLTSTIPSMTPTRSVFYTITIDENGNPIPWEGGDVDGGDSEGNSSNETEAELSKCIEGPDNEEGALDTVFQFQYLMLLDPNGDSNSVVKKIEMILHRELGTKFLTCDFPERRRMQELQNETKAVSLSSLPIDKVSAEDCSLGGADSTDEGYVCFLVDAGFSSKFVTLASQEELLQSVGAFLAWLMTSEVLLEADPSIQSLLFWGFPEGMVVIPPAPEIENKPKVDGIQSSTPSTVDYVVDSWGGILAVVAAGGLALVVLVLIASVRKRRNVFTKQVDAASLESIDAGSETYLSPGTHRSDDLESSPKFIIAQDDENSTSGYHASTQEVVASYKHNDALWNMRHNPRTCTSSTCPLCQTDQMLLPSFVPADILAAHTERDLGPPPPLSPRPGLRPKDSVDL